jgi:hypothetical protein
MVEFSDVQTSLGLSGSIWLNWEVSRGEGGVFKQGA